MKRDYTDFPEDENGDALWTIFQRGDDMSKKRDVEFTVIFPTENEALKFGEMLLTNRQQVLLCDNEESEDYPYEIVATIAMVLSHGEISAYESLLQEHADGLNGVSDGWGCHAQ